MSRLDVCPLCHDEMPGWSCACRKCGYHPDRYNRAQDDVAMIYRLSSSDCAPASTNPTAADPSAGSPPGWLGWFKW